MNLLTASELHAIIVHFPIALAFIGVPLVLAVALTTADRLALRWASIVLYLIVAVFAYAAFWTGDRARDLIPNSYPAAVWDILDTHEGLAETVWIGAAITAAFLLIGVFKFAWVRIPATTIACIASLITAVLVAITAHFGGQLVYKHSVGTPGAASLYAPLAPLIMAPATDPAVNIEPSAAPIVVQPNTPTLLPDPGPAPQVSTEPNPPIRPVVMAEAQALSYLLDVAPIMEKHCNECHYDGEAEGDLLLTSVNDMLAGGQKAGPAIIPGDPDNSPMIQYIRGIVKPQMPKKKPPLTEDEVHILRSWIQAGAVDDSAPSP